MTDLLAALMLRLLDNYCKHWGVTRTAVADAFTALDGVKDDTRRLWADFMERHCPSGSGQSTFSCSRAFSHPQLPL